MPPSSPSQGGGGGGVVDIRLLLIVAAVVGLATVGVIVVVLSNNGYSNAIPWLSSGQPEYLRTYIPQTGWHGSGSCEAHGWRARATPRRVLDVFVFNHELDLLEIRLNEMQRSPALLVPGPNGEGQVSLVTHVLIEATHTFTGKPKTLVYGSNSARFTSEFGSNAIVHEVIDDMLDVKAPASGSTFDHAFAREHHQRIDGYERGLSAAGVKDGDVVVFGDVDELPRAEAVALLARCDGILAPKVPATPDSIQELSDISDGRLIVLTSRMYVLSFEFEMTRHLHFPNAVVWNSGIGKIGELRSDQGVCLADAGWHCTYCFADPADLLTKLTSNSHTEADTAANRARLADVSRMLERYCSGGDAMNAGWAPFEPRLSTVGLPRHVRANPVRFSSLLPGRCFAAPVARCEERGGGGGGGSGALRGGGEGEEEEEEEGECEAVLPNVHPEGVETVQFAGVTG